MRRRNERLAVSFLGSLLLATTSAHGQPAAEEDDPIYGVWELDLSQSLFVDRPEPRSQTRIYERHPDGVSATVVTINADGSETRTEYVARHDSVPSPFSGAQQADAIVLERRGPYEATATFKSAARDIGTAVRNITTDGKEMTVRVTLYGNISSIAVFNKVSDDAATAR